MGWCWGGLVNDNIDNTLDGESDNNVVMNIATGDDTLGTSTADIKQSSMEYDGL